ncbi:MAG TPA: hypothetical protein VN823_16095 [Stellaceae bacterium]|nr:hypothetical protein [Stellaceae bacterium]
MQKNFLRLLVRRLQMKKCLLAAIALAAGPVLALLGPANATPIEDPFLDETQNLTNTCPAN